MRCFHKLFGISDRDLITNEEVKTRNGNTVRPYEDLVTSAKRRKLKWYGQSQARLDWPRLSYREQYKGGDEEADRGNDGKTTSKSGLALNGTAHCGKLRVEGVGCKIYGGAPTVSRTMG